MSSALQCSAIEFLADATGQWQSPHMTFRVLPLDKPAFIVSPRQLVLVEVSGRKPAILDDYLTSKRGGEESCSRACGE